jgi:peptidoglycan/LPS O-acetylase OafA/YrhL
MTLLERFSSASFKGPGFDQIRFAAALLVVFHHSWWGVDDILYRYSGGFVHLGLFAVIVFFCISGFLVTPGLQRSADVGKFAVHRALRIFPALIVVVAASMFIIGPLVTQDSLASYFSDPRLYLYAKNVTTLMAHYLPGVTEDGAPVIVNGALWTLNIEVYSYIALAGLSIVGALRHRSFALAVFVVAYIIYVGLAMSPALNAMASERLINFIGLFVYFIAGANLFLFGDRVPFSPVLAFGALIVGVAGLGVGLGPVVLPLCVSYIVVYLGLSDLPGRALFKHDLSYGIYLIHSPIILAVTELSGLRAGWLVAIITTCITLVLAYLSWNFIEKPALDRKKAASEWLASYTRRWAPLRSPVKPAPLPDVVHPSSPGE